MKMEDTLVWQDIMAIPDLLEEFSSRAEKELPSALLRGDDDSVHLVGRGSSGNATLFAKYVWEVFAGVRAEFVHPHAIFEAHHPLNFKGKAVWAFSQSGRSTDVVACLEKMKGWGARGVAVTNEPDLSQNPLARAADANIVLSHSKETAVAATKTFSLQLWLCLWAAQIWKTPFPETAFSDTVSAARSMLKNYEQFFSPQARFKFWSDLNTAPVVAFVGRGPFYGIATDAALKFREMAGLHTEAFSAAEFLHGPIGAHGPKDLVFLLSPTPALPDDLDLVRKALEARGTVYHVLAPVACEPPFSAVLADIELKVAALRFSVERGLNPDKPRGLSKVTQTF